MNRKERMKPNSSIFVSVMNATRFSPSSHSYSPLTPVSEWITQINRSMLVSYFDLITQFTSLFAMFQSISFIPIDERITLRRIFFFFESNSWLVSYCLRYLSSIMLFYVGWSFSWNEMPRCNYSWISLNFSILFMKICCVKIILNSKNFAKFPPLSEPASVGTELKIAFDAKFPTWNTTKTA